MLDSFESLKSYFASTSLEELIKHAQDPSPATQNSMPGFYKGINTMISFYVEILKSLNVRLIQKSGDTPAQILANTLYELQREKAAFLSNPNISPEIKDALIQADPEFAQKSHSFNQVVALDKQLHAINMAIAVNELNKHQADTGIIDLYCCGLTRIPMELIDLLIAYPEFTELDLGENEIAFLPDAIGQFHLVVELNLANNNLRFLPDSLGDLSSLSWFDISNNHLTTLPATLSKVHSLSLLEASGNPFRSLPSELHDVLKKTRNRQLMPLLKPTVLASASTATTLTVAFDALSLSTDTNSTRKHKHALKPDLTGHSRVKRKL